MLQGLLNELHVSNAWKAVGKKQLQWYLEMVLLCMCEEKENKEVQVAQELSC